MIVLPGLYETFVDAPFDVELGLELFGIGLTEAVFVGFPVLSSPAVESFVTDVETPVGFAVLAAELFKTDVDILAWFPEDTISAVFGFSATCEAEELTTGVKEAVDEPADESAEMIVDFVIEELGDLTSVEVGEADEEGDVVDNLIGITLSVIIWIEVEDDELDELDKVEVLEVLEEPDALDVLDLDELGEDIDDELEIISLRG